MNQQSPTSRNSSLDLIRVVAFLLLICCHACDPFNAAATYGAGQANPDFTFWGGVWGSLVRPCVPLFVMLTGALLLGRRGPKAGNDPAAETRPLPMAAFYKRRIPRVLWPFVIWSVLYYLTPWFIGLMGYDDGTVALLFPWAETLSQDFGTACERIVRAPYNFSYVACHLWYIYMLIGLYLYIPILNAWVIQATRRQKEGVLALWVLSTFLPYMTEFVSPYHFGTCDWNQFGLFYYFSGFSGYLLLGHYLQTYASFGLSKAVLAGIPMFVVGYAVSLSGYRHILSLESPTPQQIELFWTYCTPNVLLTSVALFAIFSRMQIRSARVRQLLSDFTLCGFGIYMIHYFFVGPNFGLVTALGVPVSLRIPVSGVLILLESWAVVSVLKHNLPKCFGRIILG